MFYSSMMTFGFGFGINTHAKDDIDHVNIYTHIGRGKELQENPRPHHPISHPTFQPDTLITLYSKDTAWPLLSSPPWSTWPKRFGSSSRPRPSRKNW